MSHNRRLDKLEHDEPTEPPAPTPEDIAISHLTLNELRAIVAEHRAEERGEIEPWTPEKAERERAAEQAAKRYEQLQEQAARGELAMNPNR